MPNWSQFSLNSKYKLQSQNPIIANLRLLIPKPSPLFLLPSPHGKKFLPLLSEQLSLQIPRMANNSFVDERDWSALPEDMIRLIFRKLPDLLDVVRARSVCKTWFFAASLSHLPTYLPWLLECPFCRCDGTTLGDHLCYYSVSSKRTVMIDIQNSSSIESFRGPSHGYLLLLKGRDQLVLFNPLSKETISLPSLYNSGAWPIWTGADSDPIRNQDVIVLNLSFNEWRVSCNWSFYDKASRKWITEDGFFNSGCYFQGRLFCIDYELRTNTAVYDTWTRKRIYNIVSPDEEELWLSDIFLVESAGVLLGVYLRSENRNPENVTFCIYKLDFGVNDGQPHWVRITSIDDQILFLDYMTGFSMRSARFPELRGNCIYFTYSQMGGDQHGRQPYKYDIELGTVERLECPFDCCSWFVPCFE